VLLLELKDIKRQSCCTVEPAAIRHAVQRTSPPGRLGPGANSNAGQYRRQYPSWVPTHIGTHKAVNDPDGMIVKGHMVVKGGPLRPIGNGLLTIEGHPGELGKCQVTTHLFF
jgi:hypothetical protein